MARDGCCKKLHLREDNARFILLALVMVIYMLVGAAFFQFLEEDGEIRTREGYKKSYFTFVEKYRVVGLNVTELDNLLREHGIASSAGLLNKRPRWDFAGSFYFVGTVVSTIGFGMTTPQTLAGKIMVIFYGFLGCAGGILFFNLFLERIITFLAYILRAFHEWDQRRKSGLRGRIERRGSQVSDDDSLDPWKPSVYWVMLCLFVGAVIIACCASALYSPVEKWTYFESVYFCFVTFATIGFGDYVTSQQQHYEHVHLYRLANFLFIVAGCCCIYSLFNVISIVIKQLLNWIVKKMDCKCNEKPKQRQRRNAITPGHLGRHGPKGIDLTDVDSNYDSDTDGRRNSGEMISMRDFFQANKVSLAVMQKQLYETAQRGNYITQHLQRNGTGFTSGGVGPLAILNKKLGEES